MAVAVGTDTDYSPGTGLATHTFAHTVTAGTDCLVVRTAGWLGGAGPITGVTYGGAALTFVGRSAMSSGQDRAEIWRRLSPTSGSANVIVTFTDTNNVAGSNASNLTGVDGTTPTGTVVSTVGTTGNPSIAAAGATGDLVLDAMGADATPGGTNLVGAGQTAQFSDSAGTEFKGMSTEAGAASVTMSWTRSTNSTWAIVAVAFKQTGGGGGSTAARRLPVLGVG